MPFSLGGLCPLPQFPSWALFFVHVAASLPVEPRIDEGGRPAVWLTSAAQALVLRVGTGWRLAKRLNGSDTQWAEHHH